VADTGTAPLTYQWKKNGSAIAGATSSSYTTPPAATADNASQFTVGVSNSAGTATSNAAALTVNAPTAILNASVTSLSFGSVTVSTNSVQTVTFTNAGTGNVTISSVSVSGPGFNASGLSSGTIIAPGQSATLNATFDPASSGSATGSIDVASNATSGNAVISLAGTGTLPVTHSAMLSWTPSTSSVVGYNVYVSMVSGSSYTMVANVATPSYTDGNLQASQTRYYVVTAVDSNNNESAYSNEAVANIP
jgi:beta-galactosidase